MGGCPGALLRGVQEEVVCEDFGGMVPFPPLPGRGAGSVHGALATGSRDNVPCQAEPASGAPCQAEPAPGAWAAVTRACSYPLDAAGSQSRAGAALYLSVPIGHIQATPAYCS